MTHPRMFDDDDPVLHRVREICLALPGAAEKVSHGRPAFFTGKVFAYYGLAQKVAEEWVRHDQSLGLLADPVGRAILLERPESFVPAYLGPYGWIALRLDDRTDFDELAEFVEESYRTTAPRRLVAELDARRP